MIDRSEAPPMAAVVACPARNECRHTCQRPSPPACLPWRESCAACGRRIWRKANVKALLGTNAVAGAHGRNAEEFMCRVQEGGDSPMEALERRNVGGRGIAGMADRSGSKTCNASPITPTTRTTQPCGRRDARKSRSRPYNKEAMARRTVPAQESIAPSLTVYRSIERN